MFDVYTIPMTAIMPTYVEAEAIELMPWQFASWVRQVEIEFGLLPGTIKKRIGKTGRPKKGNKVSLTLLKRAMMFHIDETISDDENNFKISVRNVGEVLGVHYSTISAMRLSNRSGKFKTYLDTVRAIPIMDYLIN